jgi:putative hydrolase
MTALSPLAAMERVVHCFNRANDSGFKAKAFARGLEVVRGLDPAELESRSRAGTLTDLDGIGSSIARLIAETLVGDRTYLDEVEAATQLVGTDDGRRYRAALRGDCHVHSRWSDGAATAETMATTARELGHEYLVLTDHSPRLTIAHGLSRERLAEQLIEIAELNRQLAPFRVFTGIEVDILEDGSLDHDDEILAGLDVVVASVHSKLKMAADDMTARMVRAVSSPHVDILGHCTGRLIDKRAPSSFDADAVFAACAAGKTAVEFNCQPDRLDPPEPLVARALDHGCWFSIDSDAHATGELEWQIRGCDRAAAFGVPTDRIINSFGPDDLLAWTQR